MTGRVWDAVEKGRVNALLYGHDRTANSLRLVCLESKGAI
jgi:hypothetical protein